MSASSDALTEDGFGPTLPQLLRPAWRRSHPALRLLLIAAAAVVLIGLALALRHGRGASFSYGGAEGPAFSFRYKGLHRAPPAAAELARLEQSDGSGLLRRLSVRSIEIEARREPISTTLPFAAARVVRSDGSAHAGFSPIAEGRTRLAVVEGREAYMVAYTARGAGAAPDGHAWIGKLLLVPEHGEAPRRALAIELTERIRGTRVAEALRRFPAGFMLNWPIRFWVQQRTSVDVPDELELPLKSFAIG
ncbi:MAG: hypothetical protein QOG09_402 [Solirubrobacterales bacterium]|nr:hypothetical protein [Solirubrobacterales bacterium]